MAFLIVLLAASALLTAVVAQSGLPPVDNTDAIGVVETTATTGTGPAKGMTTYKLALKLGSDAGNVYTIFGDENRPMSFPPAFQIPTPFGVNVSERSRTRAHTRIWSRLAILARTALADV